MSESKCTSTRTDVGARREAARRAMADVATKILVMSGKGGVGKTTVAVNLAYAIARHGLQVGLLDADLHGPNVALMTGVEGVRVTGREGRLVPVDAEPNVGVLSLSGFLENANTPVIWRGPMKAGTITQLVGEGDWRDTDVLVVDCPPGTGDEPLCVAELMPDALGVIVVTSPQDVALLDSRKCVNFVRQVGLRVLGIIENLSGYECPECGRRVDLFKAGGGERAAEEMGVPFLGRLPVTEALVPAGDSGHPLVKTEPECSVSQAFCRIADDLMAGRRPIAGKDAEEEEGVMQQTRRIAVAAEDERGLEGPVAGHFGRCPAYVVVEATGSEIQDARVVRNPHFETHEPGEVPRFVRGLDVEAILAGGMGPRAINLFSEFGIDVATGVTGSVRDAVAAYLRGEAGGVAPCAHDHPDSCGGGRHDCQH